MTKLIASGLCPICVEDLICLRVVQTGQIVFLCPLCENVYRVMPQLHIVDEINSLEDVAPGGFALATVDEVARKGVAAVHEVAFESWMPDALRAHLRDPDEG